MVDETVKPVVTDSRFKGFNPEVEASHAETGQPLNLAETAAPVEVTEAPPPPRPTHHCDNCGALYQEAMDVCASCGMSGGVVKLAD